MSPTKYRLRFLIAAMRRYFALGRPRGRFAGASIRPRMSGIGEGPALRLTVGTGQPLAKHGPIQITTVHGDPMATQDGVSVQIMAKIAWSRTLPVAAAVLQRAAGPLAYDKGPDSQDEVWARSLTQEALRTTLLGRGLAALLCQRQAAEEQVRLGIARHCEASGLIVHLVRIRVIEIPATAQAFNDARTLAAMRECIERARLCNPGVRLSPRPSSIRHPTC